MSTSSTCGWATPTRRSSTSTASSSSRRAATGAGRRCTPPRRCSRPATTRLRSTTPTTAGPIAFASPTRAPTRSAGRRRRRRRRQLVRHRDEAGGAVVGAVQQRALRSTRHLPGGAGEQGLHAARHRRVGVRTDGHRLHRGERGVRRAVRRDDRPQAVRALQVRLLRALVGGADRRAGGRVLAGRRVARAADVPGVEPNRDARAAARSAADRRLVVLGERHVAYDGLPGGARSAAAASWRSSTRAPTTRCGPSSSTAAAARSSARSSSTSRAWSSSHTSRRSPATSQLSALLLAVRAGVKRRRLRPSRRSRRTSTTARAAPAATTRRRTRRCASRRPGDGDQEAEHRKGCGRPGGR